MGLLKADLQQLGRSENFQGNDDEPGRNLFADLHLALMFYILAEIASSVQQNLCYLLFLHVADVSFCKVGKIQEEFVAKESNMSFLLNKKCTF